MFLSKALLSLLMVALSAANASPLRHDTKLKTVSIASTMHTKSATKLSAANKARTRALREADSMHERGNTLDLAIHTDSVPFYFATVGVGVAPITDYTLAIDTASANTWIASTYTPTADSVNTGKIASMYLMNGNVFGEQWKDVIYFGSGELTTYSQSMTIADNYQLFTHISDGVLGLGPTNLSFHTVADTETVATVMDNLYTSGQLDLESIGIFFIPSVPSGSVGELCFGGADISKTATTLEYYPITSTFPASNYWGLNMSISYDNTVIMATTSGIIDSLTPLVSLPTDAYESYKDVTGAVTDPPTGLLTITNAQYAALKDLVFNVGSNGAYRFTANAQIWPRSLNTLIAHGSSDLIYLVIDDIGHFHGTGLDFVLGTSWLQRMYAVLDTTNHQIGLALTQYTDANSN